MRILKDHYEKIILVASLVCATVISLISLLSVPESVVQDDGSELDMFWFDTNDNGEQVLEFSKETRLSPGDTLTFVSKEDENSFKTFEIAKIALKSRDSYALEIDGKIIDGMLMSNNDLFLDRTNHTLSLSNVIIAGLTAFGKDLGKYFINNGI